MRKGHYGNYAQDLVKRFYKAYRVSTVRTRDRGDMEGCSIVTVCSRPSQSQACRTGGHH